MINLIGLSKFVTTILPYKFLRRVANLLFHWISRQYIWSEISEHSRLAFLIEFIDHLPVNKLNASGLSGRKQKPLRKNSVCFITREQFKMIENKPVNTLRQGFTAISDIIAFFVTFQSLIANIFRSLLRDLLVKTRKVKQHTYLMLQKCLF